MIKSQTCVSFQKTLYSCNKSFTKWIHDRPVEYRYIHQRSSFLIFLWTPSLMWCIDSYFVSLSLFSFYPFFFISYPYLLNVFIICFNRFCVSLAINPMFVFKMLQNYECVCTAVGPKFFLICLQTFVWIGTAVWPLRLSNMFETLCVCTGVCVCVCLKSSLTHVPFT